MKTMKNALRTVLCLTVLTLALSCSNDDDVTALGIQRSFTTNADTDFLINSDGTVNLMVSGAFQDTSPSSSVTSRGFVYGASTNTEVSETNTVVAIGPQNSVTGDIINLPSGQTYYIRGYFEMSDGTYFYGNEIQSSTDVDASSTRTITMEMESDPFFISQTEVTPTVNLSDIAKEMPMEIGYEYSVNDDFSSSTLKDIEGYQGNILTTSYASELITGLTASTTYYFRPYAKYADGTVTNGGTSSASFTTNN